MKNRNLSDLFDTDNKGRWTIFAISIVVTAVIGLVAETNGSSIISAEIFAAISGGLVLFVQMFVYGTAAGDKLRRQVDLSLQLLLGPLLTISAIVVIAFFVSASTPVLEASVLNRRLAAALKVSQPTKRNKETARVLKYATQFHTKLQPELVLSAVKQLEKSDDPAAWPAYLSALDYQVSSNSPKLAGGGSFSQYGTMHLDNLNLSGFVFSNYNIIYQGGPVSLTGVVFKNVRFQVADNENGRKFVEAVLSSKNGTLSIYLR